jgi:hypothetical protein
MRVDYCKGCRKTYGAALELLASNNWIVGFMGGMPLYYLAIMMIIYHKGYVASLLSGGSYSFLGVLIAGWINAGICLWRVWPNGLTLSIFVLKALGYWSFVSFFILLFYGLSRLPLEIATYLVVMIMPEILLLLFTADVLRAARTRHFKALERAAATTYEHASAHSAGPETVVAVAGADAV